MVESEGGSDPAGSGTPGGAPPAGSKNPTAKASMDQVYAENEELTRANVELTNKLTAVTTERDEANAILEKQVKNELISQIMARSNCKSDALWPLSIPELKVKRNTLDEAMPPRVNSVRFGVHGADLSDREKGLTVGDLSIVTAARRKAA